jgi:hypothetical protein
MLRDCHVVYILRPHQHEHLKVDATKNGFAVSKNYQINRYFNFLLAVHFFKCKKGVSTLQSMAKEGGG